MRVRCCQSVYSCYKCNRYIPFSAYGMQTRAAIQSLPGKWPKRGVHVSVKKEIKAFLSSPGEGASRCSLTTNNTNAIILDAITIYRLESYAYPILNSLIAVYFRRLCRIAVH